MAVAHDAYSDSPSSLTSTNSGSGSWTHTPVGTPRGVWVGYFEEASSTDHSTAVSYGGSSLATNAAWLAKDTAGETGLCKIWFLGSSVPTGASTVSITTTATNWCACCITVTAGADTEIYTSGVVLLQEDGTLAEQSVTDGSTGVNSMRYAAMFSGLNTPGTIGSNSTSLRIGDLGTDAVMVCRETTAGQGSRSVGWTNATSDDRAGVFFAVREVTGGGGGRLFRSANLCTGAGGPFFANPLSYPQPKRIWVLDKSHIVA